MDWIKKISKYKTWIILGITMVICGCILFSVFDIGSGTLSKALSYNGGDDVNQYAIAKIIVDNGWVWNAANLGAPFSADTLDFAPTTMDIINLLLMRFIACFTSNQFLVVNIVYVLAFFFICVNSYLVMVYLKVNEYLAGALSLTYSFLSYILLRGVAHLVLSTYYFVPFAILVCVWIARDELFTAQSKKKTICAGIICLLIGMNGIAYYPFFACALMAIMGIGTAIGRKKMKSLFKAIACCATVCVSLVICLAPHIYYILCNGKTGIGSRSSVEAEYYGLKIVQLLLPINSWPGPFRRIQEAYATAPLPNEGSEYLGIVAVIGFVILIVGLFVPFRAKDDKDLLSITPILQKLNIAAVLIGTIGGLGSLFAIVVSGALRGYNRISTYIAFICLLAIGIYLTYLIDRLPLKRDQILSFIGVFALCSISIYDQIPSSIKDRDYSDIYTEMDSDRGLVEQIESLTPGGMIFQLPFHKYPEYGLVNEMEDYDLFKPYLYSSDLKWSYGAPKGRSASAWSQIIASLNTEDMVKNLAEAGFSGIFINREAYPTEEWTDLENQICAISGEEKIESSLGNLSYIPIVKYRDALVGDSGYSVQTSAVLHQPMYIISGSYGVEGEPGEQWIWMESNAMLSVANFSDTDIEDYTFSFNAYTDCEGDYWVKVKTPEGETTYPLNKSVFISQTMTLHPGDNKISISTNAPKIYAPNDARQLYLKLSDLDFSIIKEKKTKFTVSGAWSMEGEPESGQWIWLYKDSTISIDYPYDTAQEFTYSFNLATDYDGGYWVRIKNDNGVKEYPLIKSVDISDTIELKPGINTIEIETNAPQVVADDPRELYIRMSKIDLFDQFDNSTIQFTGETQNN